MLNASVRNGASAQAQPDTDPAPSTWKQRWAELPACIISTARRDTNAPGRQAVGCHVVLLEASSDGPVLVDTGLGTEDYTQINSRLGWAFAYGTPSR